MDTNEIDDLLAVEERYKTTLHYTVGKLSQKAAVDREKAKRFPFDQNSQTPPIRFTKEFVAMLTEVTWSMVDHWAKDLEAFASHAKRSVVNADDVRLLARRSPSLIKLLDEVADVEPSTAQESTSEEPAKRGKKRPINADADKEEHAVHSSTAASPIEILDEETTSPSLKSRPSVIDDDEEIDAAILMMSDDF